MMTVSELAGWTEDPDQGRAEWQVAWGQPWRFTWYSFNFTSFFEVTRNVVTLQLGIYSANTSVNLACGLPSDQIASDDAQFASIIVGLCFHLLAFSSSLRNICVFAFIESISASIPSHRHQASISLLKKGLTMNPAEESRRRRNYDASQSSRDRSISPPPKRYASTASGRLGVEERGALSISNATAPSTSSSDNGNNHSKSTKEVTKSQSRIFINSPVQLNFVEQLPASSNVDCISLGNILGDPMIKECWLFNYLFDIDFVM